MNTVIVKLPMEQDNLEIHLFSDWHIGDRQANLNNIYKMIQTVAEKENAYCVLMGDLINNATKTSVSDVYADEVNPMEQVERLVAMLQPVKDKILFVCQGNHEARTWKNDGIDISQWVANNLGIRDRYCREGGALFIQYGRSPKSCEKSPRQRAISAYIAHGCGGGRKEGGKVNRLADIACICDVDLYCVGHTHMPLIMKNSFFRLDVQHGQMIQVEKTFVNASAQLDDYGGYGAAALFKPTSTTCPVILIQKDKIKAIL